MTDFSQHIRQSLQSTGRLVAWLALAGIIIWSVSGIYSVEPGEVAVHIRFGRVLDGAVLPGIHPGLPFPIDEVFKVPVKTMRSIRIQEFSGTRLPGDEPQQFTVLSGIPAYCLTGDNNIVNITCVGQYTVQEAGSFLFATTSPEDILRRVINNALIHCLSAMSVDAILTTGKRDIADFVRSWANRRLGEFRCGIQVQFLELKTVEPPPMVQEDFQGVIKAGIDRKKMINEAESYEGQSLASAKAQAEKLIQQGIADKTDAMAKANGLTVRFLKRLSEYEKNPVLVRRKDYIDFFSFLGKQYPHKILLNTVDGKAPVNLRLLWPN